jgi:hypothetical protein
MFKAVMKVSYKYRKTNERKAMLKNIVARKEQKKYEDIVAKGGSTRMGRWSERKPHRYSVFKISEVD